LRHRLETEPQTLERDSLRLYVERKIRVIESELLRLAHTYSVQNITELDEMIRQGKYHEDEAFAALLRHRRTILSSTIWRVKGTHW